MIKKEMSIKRCLIAASMAGTMVFSSIPAVPVFAADTVLATAYYEGDGDGIGVNGFNFYTTTKPTKKKIPASDKWTYIRDGYTVDLSNVKKAVTYYFAKTPNPSDLSEIVAISVGKKEATAKVTYTAGSLDVANTVKGSGDTSDAEAREAARDKAAQDMFANATGLYCEFSPNSGFVYDGEDEDFGTSGSYSDLSGSALAELQRVGGTIYFFKPAEYTGTANVIEIKEVDSTTGMMKADFSTAVKRPTIPKAVKIAKAAKGPAVKIDYANHTLTLKQGNSVKKISDYDDAYSEYVSGTEATEWTTIANKTDTIGVSNGALYAVKTVKTKKADSLPTFVQISASANASFQSTGSTVAIVGEYNNPAVLYVQSKSTATDAEAFQYSIVDSISGLYTTANNTSTFSYSEAAKLKWKSVKTKKDTKIGTANLTWKNVGGKYVVIRKAAVGSNYSSKVVIYKAPDSAANTWSFIASHEYQATGDNASFKTSGDAHRSAKIYVDYDGTATASADAFVFDVESGANTINANGKITAKLITGKSVTAKVAGKTYKKIAYTESKISKEQLPVQTSATDVEFSFPKGAIQYTINGKTVDAPAMKITTKYGGSEKTLPIALTENLAANTSDPDDSYDGEDISTTNGNGGDSGGGTDDTAPTITSWGDLSAESVIETAGDDGLSSTEKEFSITFSEELNSSDLGTVTLTGAPNDKYTVKNGSIVVNGSTVKYTVVSGYGSANTIKSRTGVSTSTTLKLKVAGFKDLAGNTMSEATKDIHTWAAVE